MSLNSVVNRLVRAAASVPQDISDTDLDTHVAKLLAAEAKANDAKWQVLGLGAYLNSGGASGSGSRDSPDPSLPKPNKRFLASVIRTVDGHNQALLRQQAQAASDARDAYTERSERADAEARADARAEARKGARSGASRLFGGALANLGGLGHGQGRRSRDSPTSGRDTTGRDSGRESGRDSGRSTPRPREERERESRRKRSRSRSPVRDRDREKDRRRSPGRERERERDRERDHDRDYGRDRRRSRYDSGADSDSDCGRDRRRRRDCRDRDDSRDRDRDREPRKDKGKGRERDRDRDRNRDRDRERDREDKSKDKGKDSRPRRRPSPSPPPLAAPLPPGSPPRPPTDRISRMDKYFHQNYDPRLDVGDVPATGIVADVGWDSMLAVLKDRGKKRRRNSPTLSSSPEPAKRDRSTVSSRPTIQPATAKDVASKDMKTLLEMEYTRKGGVREWDKGKEA